ncbi:ibr domain containing protein [Stylonychia lemnae]|uniref:RBR-type E3 ubiquitin transferase n=1 Tax=Stylonychia lemnae TaxID=5949 RepID=A0A078AUW3_STYLE|nr:ibr domain containing protein [Stylonychia lemnae]|eukprot:CDW84658.1 ibr domain containing protein [Stylonychia lemnae]
MINDQNKLKKSVRENLLSNDDLSYYSQSDYSEENTQPVIRNEAGSNTKKESSEFNSESQENQGPNSGEIECRVILLSLEKNQIDQFICPIQGCLKKISGEVEVKIVFQSDDFEIRCLYEDLEYKNSLKKQPLLRFCPKQNCGGFGMAQNFNEKFVKCQDCDNQICFECREDWHGDFTSCESAMNKKLNGIPSDNLNVSYCPKCKTKVENLKKKDQDNLKDLFHITCYFCKFEWCWNCRGTYAYDHYLPINPFGCGLRLFAKKHKWYIQTLINFGWLLVILLLLPLWLIIQIPIALTAYCFEGPFELLGKYFCKNPLACVLGLIVVVILFTIGMAINLIAIPLFLTVGIPLLIGFMIHQRAKVHKKSNKLLEGLLSGNMYLGVYKQ